MRLLFPCDPFNKKKPDEVYADEFESAQMAGISCSLLSPDFFDFGDFKIYPDLLENEIIIYRGWMLTIQNYLKLQNAIELKGGKILNSIEQYKLCHYLPEWYSLCEEFTPQTIFVDKNADFKSILTFKKWSAYFVKDYVKSLTTSRGSIAKTIDEISEIVTLIEKFRGQIEGGLCIREFEDLRVETEERYFVYQQIVFSRNGFVPEMVQTIAKRINNPFFSVDIVSNSNGSLRLIELGDGQVSDKKNWSAKQFIDIFVS